MKLKAIDPSGFVLKTQYDADKSGLEKKINDTDKKYLILLDFLKKNKLQRKITKIEGNIPNITGLATTATRNVV